MNSYDDYRTQIANALSAATPRSRRELVHDILGRIASYAENAPKEALWPEEVQLIDDLVGTVRSNEFHVATMKATLKRFEELAQKDEVHATETDSDVIDFLVAMEALVDFERLESVKAAAAISESLMNILDRSFTNETSLSEWLTVPELRNEFNRQLAFLGEPV